eukprot:359374-Chlamydomonas_euryale.AAC.4
MTQAPPHNTGIPEADPSWVAYCNSDSDLWMPPASTPARNAHRIRGRPGPRSESVARHRPWR